MFHFLRRMATHSIKFNRLKLEKSPYLLQHASNPVEWYPWGEEAFAESKKTNKVIFLSVGYSTCHWCHVMEKESFENEDTAKIMNTHFINIKVDREERPDVDKVYMSFLMEFTGSGGWPMSVFLTPDLKPIYAGTYFPPDDRYKGLQNSFPSLLKSMVKNWNHRPELLKKYGESVVTNLMGRSKLTLNSSNVEPPILQVIANCSRQLMGIFEANYGGFSPSPKFPHPSNLNFIFGCKAIYAEDAEDLFNMAVYTLVMMGKGGIHDHVGNGFSRYSTDEEWHVPHFEKMLYDQAQLVHSYLDAYLTTRKSCFADLARDILTYVTRDLSHPEGGFYSAEDADSLPTEDSLEKVEGAFYVWEYSEIQDLLQEKLGNSDYSLADIFTYHYSVTENGNVEKDKDMHGNFTNKNILIVRGNYEETAKIFSIDEITCKSVLEKARKILFDARNKRPRPHLDDKMLTAWNGMMLSAMARAGAVLGDQSYIQRAVKNAHFIKKYLFRNEKLIRTAYKSENGGVSIGSEIEAYSDDYAWVIRGFIDLYFATLNYDWLQDAEFLQQQQGKIFWDTENGGFFLSKQDDSRILLKLKEDHDGAEPSINSISSGNLVKLSRLLNNSIFNNQAKGIFKIFSHRLNKIPLSLPEMALSYMLHHNQAEQIIFSGQKDSDELKQMLYVVQNSLYNPNRILLLADNNEDSLLYKKHENLYRYKPKENGKVMTFICRNFNCALPATSMEELTELMNKSASITPK